MNKKSTLRSVANDYLTHPNKDSGITLIALVITIIVLLILAGISISMLAGDNSILQKATDAKTQTGIGQEKETIALAYNSALAKKVSNGYSSAVTDSELNDELDSSEATASGNPIIVTFIKSGNAYEIESNGNIKESTPRDPNASNLTVAELSAIDANNTANPTDQIEEITSSVTNINLKDSTKIKAVLTGDVPIPVGANYLEGTVDTGVVIEYKRSEFVWVPVPVTANNSLYPKGTTKAMAKVSTAEGFAGTDDNGRTNYEGVLYDFGSLSKGGYGPPTFTSYSTSQVMSNYGQGTENYREPDVVSYYDIDDLATLKSHTYDGLQQTFLSEIGLNETNFKKGLQEEYNAMIESVVKYGGFYVGRYETSISGISVASVSGEVPMSAESGGLWYGMYDKQKKFSGKESSDSMQSSMIWGSQYDAMLNWMQEGGKDVNAKDKGEHTQLTTTGGTNTDIINNIYDLEGNFNEWTLEASRDNGRACRAGTTNNEGPASLRYEFDSYSWYSWVGSRLSLYIK